MNFKDVIPTITEVIFNKPVASLENNPINRGIFPIEESLDHNFFEGPGDQIAFIPPGLNTPVILFDDGKFFHVSLNFLVQTLTLKDQFTDPHGSILSAQYL